jgi:hypothetical protein
MRIRFSRKASRILIAGVMLFAFAVRSLIPAGFMPSSERPFSAEICPEGFPAELLVHAGHHHHGAGHSYTDHCVFGTACVSGSPSHSSVLTDVSLSSLAAAAPSVARAIVVRLVFLPHSRGPPVTD